MWYAFGLEFWIDNTLNLFFFFNFKRFYFFYKLLKTNKILLHRFLKAIVTFVGSRTSYPSEKKYPFKRRFIFYTYLIISLKIFTLKIYYYKLNIFVFINRERFVNSSENAYFNVVVSECLVFFFFFFFSFVFKPQYYLLVEFYFKDKIVCMST